MKKILVLIALPLLLIADTAFGELKLEGYWCVDEVCKGTALPDPPTGFVIEISEQSAEGLFKVDNLCSVDDEPCYGVIEGNNIYITCWDNIIVGQVKGHTMSFISHIQNPNSEQAATCKGTATKIPGYVDPCDCP